MKKKQDKADEEIRRSIERCFHRVRCGLRKKLWLDARLSEPQYLEDPSDSVVDVLTERFDHTDPTYLNAAAAAILEVVIGRKCESDDELAMALGAVSWSVYHTISTAAAQWLREHYGPDAAAELEIALEDGDVVNKLAYKGERV